MKILLLSNDVNINILNHISIQNTEQCIQPSILIIKAYFAMYPRNNENNTRKCKRISWRHLASGTIWYFKDTKKKVFSNGKC